MNRPYSRFTLGTCCWLGLLWPAIAGPLSAQQPDASQPTEFFVPADVPSVTEMAARIDAALAAQWEQDGVTPAEPASDAEFLRRVYLDLTGVTPTVTEARRFLADDSADKRTRLIDHLLDSPRYALHLSNTWRRILMPEGISAEQLQNARGLQDWLRQQFAANLPYDALVARFLVADRADQAGPGIFYTSLDLEPEKLAARTSQVFLGLQMQCAQCHDHPFDNWSQQDFWGYAAFFARIERKVETRQRRVEYLLDRPQGEVMIPDTDEVVPPKYPHGRDANPAEGGTRREQLLIWMASRDNPFLPRAAVNRVWAHLFGRGFVEPVDDMSPQNPPSHPELLDELSRYFARSGFDLQRLFRTIANSQAYQLSSQYPDQPAADEYFARMLTKTLTAEQLYDCLEPLMMSYQDPSADTAPVPAGWGDMRRLQFVSQMQTQSRSATDFDRGVPQALLLMNGEAVDGATDPEQGRLLSAVAAPFLTDEQRLEAIYLATLSRLPTDLERQRLHEYLSTADDRETQQQRLGDLVWVLINTAEFTLNH